MNCLSWDLKSAFKHLSNSFCGLQALKCTPLICLLFVMVLIALELLRFVFCALSNCYFFRSDEYLLLLFLGQMTDLIYAEKDLIQSLQEYIRAEEKKLSQIKR